MDCSLPGSSVHEISPGKNTGVGCQLLLQGILLTQGSNPSSLRLLQALFTAKPIREALSLYRVCVSYSVVPDSVALQAPVFMGFSRQEYWSGCHSILQGIFPTQGSNLGHLHCRWILYHLSHQGSPSVSELKTYTHTKP